MTKQVICKLDGHEYGIDILLVSAIEKYTGIVPIPNAPAYIIGILNLRGDVVPVYSLRKKFGMPEIPPTETTQLIVARCAGMLVGFKVDAVDQIEEFSDDHLHPMPVIVKNDDTKYAGQVANYKKGMVVLIDIENLLTEQEKKAVKDFAEATAND